MRTGDGSGEGAHVPVDASGEAPKASRRGEDGAEGEMSAAVERHWQVDTGLLACLRACACVRGAHREEDLDVECRRRDEQGEAKAQAAHAVARQRIDVRFANVLHALFAVVLREAADVEQAEERPHEGEEEDGEQDAADDPVHARGVHAIGRHALHLVERVAKRRVEIPAQFGVEGEAGAHRLDDDVEVDGSLRLDAIRKVKVARVLGLWVGERR